VPEAVKVHIELTVPELFRVAVKVRTPVPSVVKVLVTGP
jgi:hypothetical protein